MMADTHTHDIMYRQLFFREAHLFDRDWVRSEGTRLIIGGRPYCSVIVCVCIFYRLVKTDKKIYRPVKAYIQ